MVGTEHQTSAGTQTKPAVAGNPRATVASTRLPPVAFDLRQRRVRLLDLRGVDFDGPTFIRSVARLREAHPEAPLLEISMDELLVQAAHETLQPPAGLIFNAPRSGSTLLANMLAAPASHVVIKQSQTVNVLLREIILAEADPQETRIYQEFPRLDSQTAEALLTILVSRLTSCSRATDGSTGRVILKPSSWGVNAAATLLRIFPETPAIFLFRNPAEVVASLASTPPQHPPYVPMHDRPRESMYPFMTSLRHASSDITPAGFYAHVWRSAVEPALALPPERVLILDYTDLTGDPAGVLDHALSHLRLTPSPAERAAMQGELGLYSKARGGPETFDPSGRHRRTPLTDEQKDTVSAVVGELPRQLSDRRRGV